MNYMVFFRVLDYNHAMWGPQWSHKYEVVDVNPPVSTTEDLAAIHDVLAAANQPKKVEIVSAIPLPAGISQS